MTSFTSNSSKYAPDLPWTRVWLTAIILAVALVGGWEAFWRSQGWQPSVANNPGTWSVARASVNRDPNVVAVVGASSFQLGVDPDVMAQTVPGPRYVQLAYNGATPWQTILEIGDDPNFTGTLVFEFLPTHIFGVDEEWEPRSLELVHFYKHRPVLSDLEMRGRLFLQWHMVSLQQRLHPLEVMTSLVKKRALPEPYYIRFLPNRYAEADYTMLDPADLQRRMERQVRKIDNLPDRGVDEVVTALTRVVTQIEGRGGRVVAVRSLRDNIVGEAITRRFPDDRYWNRVVAIPGLETFDLGALPQFSGFRTADGTHLDRRDVPSYTAEITKLIAKP